MVAAGRLKRTKRFTIKSLRGKKKGEKEGGRDARKKGKKGGGEGVDGYYSLQSYRAEGKD